jgi:glutaredoxin 3
MITIYSTKTCRWCVQVEKYLDYQKVAYEKVMVDQDPALWQELYDKLGHMTVPITTDGTKYVIGYNIGQLKELIGD